MKLDFTLSAYRELLITFLRHDYFFITFAEYIKLRALDDLPAKFIILRHDVDNRAQNSMTFANIQADMGIKGTYYFRVLPQSFDKAIIRAMIDQEHEVGYHYETMDTSCGNIDDAYQEFKENLNAFTALCEIQTISMHGSPLSKFDNRDIWRKYSYKDLGISAEPYFDFDFNKVFYLTDTGRAWDGFKYNIRDKAPKENPLTNDVFLNLRYHSSFEIIEAVSKGLFPKQAMLNFHPERWTSSMNLWLIAYISQNIKNQIKWILIQTRKLKK